MTSASAAEPTGPAGAAEDPGPATGPAPTPGGPVQQRPGLTSVAVVGFLVLTGVLLVLGKLAVAHQVGIGRQEFEQGIGWWGQWVRWDGNWYFHIASEGYGFQVGEQQSIAFWPTYPMAMRGLALLTNDEYDAGLIITWLSGLAFFVLLARWCRDRMDRAAGVATIVTLLVYPYVWYLSLSVYADAMFAACAIGAFLLLERDRPIPAGLLGLVAAAARPMGMAVAIGLVVLAMERRDVIPPITAGPGDGRVRRGAAYLRVPRALCLRRLRPRDVGVLVAFAGPLLYMGYLWSTRGDPLAFVEAESAPGWNHTPGLHSWLKVDVFEYLRNVRRIDQSSGAMLLHGALAVGAVLLLPRVVRRFGLGYGMYALVLVGIPTLSSSNFIGLGRYLLSAFPVVAVVGEWLSGRRLAVRGAVWATSGVLLCYLAYTYARGGYVA